ncbi:unnamed protein product [Prorocentrum cordatum]|uniref:Uncharacterized protein n=1 Tax=Prorocentrum cordatum TaxID=2364126 RepID=A0ABN9TCR4_9DINO|nr:unnamed protein product [Polarella glacialis]
MDVENTANSPESNEEVQKIKQEPRIVKDIPSELPTLFPNFFFDSASIARCSPCDVCRARQTPFLIKRQVALKLGVIFERSRLPVVPETADTAWTAIAVLPASIEQRCGLPLHLGPPTTVSHLKGQEQTLFHSARLSILKVAANFKAASPAAARKREKEFAWMDSDDEEGTRATPWARARRPT